MAQGWFARVDFYWCASLLDMDSHRFTKPRSKIIKPRWHNCEACPNPLENQLDRSDRSPSVHPVLPRSPMVTGTLLRLLIVPLDSLMFLLPFCFPLILPAAQPARLVDGDVTDPSLPGRVGRAIVKQLDRDLADGGGEIVWTLEKRVGDH